MDALDGVQSWRGVLARINIEDSLLKDDKFTDLCIKLGSRIYALGVITEAYILAQKFYLNESTQRLIPLSEWSRKKDLHILLEVFLAEEFEHGIYIKGSKESFKWLLQRSGAGKLSASSKRIKRQMESTVVERGSTAEYGSQPLTLTLTHTLKESNTNMRKSASDLLSKIECLYFELYPLKKGKSKGVKILSKQIKTEEDLKNLELAIKKYSASIKDPQYTKHFSTFAGEWRDWLDENAGLSKGVQYASYDVSHVWDEKEKP